MVEENVKPDLETFAIVIGSCLPSNNSQRAYEYVLKMARFELPLTAQFCDFLKKIATSASDSKGETVFQNLLQTAQKNPQGINPKDYLPLVQGLSILKTSR